MTSPPRLVVASTVLAVAVGLVPAIILSFAPHRDSLFATFLSWMTWFSLAAYPVLGVLLVRALVNRRSASSDAATAMLYLLGILAAASALVVFLLQFQRNVSGNGLQLCFMLLAQSVCMFVASVQMDGWTRRLRRGEGLIPTCDHCGYDLRGTLPAGIDRCPECGSAIARRSRGLADLRQNRDIARHADDSD